MSGIGLIINDKSNRTPDVLDELLYVARGYSSVCPEVLDGVKGLDRTLKSMGRKDIDTLIVAGGDGTLQATFTDVFNHDRFERSPNYVALPCGMTNVIAYDCGLQGPPADSLDNFLWRRTRDEVQTLERPLLRVTAGERDPTYGFFFGAGAFHSAVAFSRSSIQSTGARRSIALAASVGGYILKRGFSARAVGDEIDVAFGDDRPGSLPPNAVEALFLVTTLTKLGSGIYPFWGKGPGGMAVTAVDAPLRRLFRAAPYVLSARDKPWFEDYGYRSWRTDRLQAAFDGPYVFDGEIFDTQKEHPLRFGATKSVKFLH